MTEQTAAETHPTALVPAPVPALPEAAAPVVAEPAAPPVDVAAGTADAPVAEPVVVAEAAPEEAAPRRKASPRQLVSDETLDAWQATLAAKRAAKERAERQIRAEAEARQARAEAFRVLRQALQRDSATPAAAEIDPEIQALADDDLARQVHLAPAHVREVLSATLAMMTGKRRPSRR